MSFTGKIFDFFALPRELRDLILSHACLFGTEDEIRISFSTQRTSPILVSHQFSSEYSSAFTKALSLAIRDTGHAPDIEETAIPLEARTSKGLSLDLTIACTANCQPSECDISDETITHISALRRITAQVPSVRAIEIHLHIRPHANMASAKKAISVGARNLVKSEARVKVLSVFTIGTVTSRFEEAWKSGVRVEIGRWVNGGGEDGLGRVVFLDGREEASVDGVDA